MKKDMICFSCHDGVMEKIKEPKTFDYNHDGNIFRVCNNCSITNDTRRSIDQYILKTCFTNSFIEKVLEVLCDRGRRFSFNIKRDIENKLKNQSINNADELSDLIIMEAENHNVTIDRERIIIIIYARCGAYLSFNSWS